ncbi:hypothetical protein BZA77DRAFT_297050 [Pyronema omphalodes]|nr:hypothetical protein BZA77DRAFT_297050 [Pyronema omphalodes]
MAVINAFPLKVQGQISIVRSREITLEPGELLLTVVLSILFGIVLGCFGVYIWNNVDLSRESLGARRFITLPRRGRVISRPFFDVFPASLTVGFRDGSSNYGTMPSLTGVAALHPAGHRRPRSPVPSFPSSSGPQTGTSTGLLTVIEDLTRPVTPTNPGITISPPISEYSPRRSRAVSEPIRIKRPAPNLDLQQYANGTDFADDGFLAPRTATQGRRGPGGKWTLAPIPQRSDTGTSDWSEFEWDENTGRMVKKTTYSAYSEFGEPLSPTAESFNSRNSEGNENEQQDVLLGEDVGMNGSDCRQS